MKTAILVALGTGLIPIAARATIVHHDNPVPGAPGHYAWAALVGVPTWLDITLPAAAQTNTETASSIAQGLGGFPGGWANWGVLIGGSVNQQGPWSTFAVADDDEAYVLALSHGDALNGLRYDGWSLYALGMPPNVYSLFPEGEHRYIGVRTGDGRYGWVEVARTGQSLAAFSWAYETVPGVPILAGQIPAPGAVVLILAPLTAFLRRRT
ncbi:MAG: hypothetical protein KF864_00095 [Phycisphaeraceae bacterium]|nr:hypothetical protein [Phycisphaeraceae bacterium]